MSTPAYMSQPRHSNGRWGETPDALKPSHMAPSAMPIPETPVIPQALYTRPQPTPLAKSVEELNQARKQAQDSRRQALQEAFNTGGPAAEVRLFALANQPGGEALQNIKLTQLLHATRQQSLSDAKTRVRRILDRAGATAKPTSQATIGWLLDGRTNHERLNLWADATGPLRDPEYRPPWVGWPWTAQPRYQGVNA